MILGIDLGTTKAVAGYYRHGKLCIVSDNNENWSIPSLVLVTPDGDIFAGNAAKQHRNHYLGKNTTISSVKRMMGKKGETSWGQLKTYPQEVSAFVLAEVKYLAEKQLGEKISQAVIAIPSHFDESQRRATKEAARIAGFKVERLLNEATAAAIAYGLGKNKSGKIVVFDLGGGTLDISVLEVGENVYEVLCIEGDSQLGGDDFDKLIIDHILEHVRNKFGTDVYLDNAQSLVLKESAEQAKIELSNTSKARIFIPGFLSVNGKRKDIDITIDRNVFEELCQPLFDRSILLLKKALLSAGLSGSEVSALLLLGGSSRIPKIRERITSELHIKPYTGVNPLTCVAEGATILAECLSGESNSKDMLLLDAVPSSYGVGSNGGTFNCLIKKDTIIPTQKSEVFTTTEDNQSVIQVPIYQGEQEFIKDNTFLGVVELNDIPPAAKGVPQIEITFDVDPNMLVHVSAKDLGTGSEQNVAIQSPYGLTETHIRAMQKKMQQWSSNRMNRHLAESLICDVNNLLKTSEGLLTEQETSELKDMIAFMNTVAKKEKDTSKISEMIKEKRIIYQSNKDKAERRAQKVNASNKLISHIDKSYSEILNYDKDKADVLHQGTLLLKDYMQLSYPITELEKIYSYVRLEYENTKASIITDALCDLTRSEQIKRWISGLRNEPPSFENCSGHLKHLRTCEFVSNIIRLLENDSNEYRKNICQKAIVNIPKDTISWALFVVVCATFIDYQMISTLENTKYADDTGLLITLLLFNSLDLSKPLNQRRLAAKSAASYLPLHTYLPHILFHIDVEPDEHTCNELIGYIKRHSEQDFCRFFSSANKSIKKVIVGQPDILAKIAANAEGRNSLIALYEDFTNEDDLEVLIALGEALARYLEPEKYMPKMIRVILAEQNDCARNALSSFLDRIPEGSLYKFYTDADPDTQRQMKDSGDIVIRLAKEPVESSKLLAISSLQKIQHNEVYPTVCSLINDEAWRVRYNALKLVMQYYRKDGHTPQLFRTALCDNAPEIRLLALDYIREIQDSSLISDVRELVKREKVEKVIEKSVNILSSKKKQDNLISLYELSLSSNPKIQHLALSSLESHVEVMTKIDKKFFKRLKQIVQSNKLKRRHIFQLKRLSKRDPKIADIFSALRKRYSKNT